MSGWMLRGTAAAAALLLGATLTASAQEETSGGAAPSTGSEPVSIVVIGDSIPYNAYQDCPGCTSFAASYGDAIEAAAGRPVSVSNVSRHDGANTGDIDAQLGSGGLDTLLSTADVVIISVGFNDQPPYDVPSRPCSTSELVTNEQLFAAVIAITTACVDEVTAETRGTAASVLAQVRAKAPEAAIGVLTSYNAWTGWPDLEAAGSATAGAVTEVIVYGLEAWRSALCEEAAAVGATCIDLLEPFNGPAGRIPAGDLLAADYTHPSQLGNDLISDLLLESGLYPLPGATPGR
jgi:lysophospholipase L1-like esterase